MPVTRALAREPSKTKFIIFLRSKKPRRLTQICLFILGNASD